MPTKTDQFFAAAGWLAVSSLVLPLVLTTFSAVGGWVAGWLFNDTYAAISAHLGWPFAAWQTGAALGFVGSNLKTRVAVEQKRDA